MLLQKSLRPVCFCTPYPALTNMCAVASTSVWLSLRILFQDLSRHYISLLGLSGNFFSSVFKFSLPSFKYFLFICSSAYLSTYSFRRQKGMEGLSLWLALQMPTATRTGETEARKVKLHLDLTNKELKYSFHHLLPSEAQHKLHRRQSISSRPGTLMWHAGAPSGD